MKQYFVYMLTNKHNTVLYTGSTDNLVKRVYQHKSKAVEGFTKKYNIEKLVYYEIIENASTMVERERAIKNLKRDKKLGMINKMNPTFRDLFNKLT